MKFGMMASEDLDKTQQGHIWRRVLTKGQGLSWENEDHIAAFVQDVLIEAIEASKMQSLIRISEKRDIGHSCRPDAVVLRFVNGAAISVIEVKMPGKKDDNALKFLSNGAVLGQVLDYLLTLRRYHGVEHPFAILTTYTHWRVCWLPISDAVAALPAPSIEEITTLLKQRTHQQGADQLQEQHQSLDTPTTGTATIVPAAYQRSFGYKDGSQVSVQLEDDSQVSVQLEEGVVDESENTNTDIHCTEVYDVRDAHCFLLICSALRKMPMTQQFKRAYCDRKALRICIDGERNLCWKSLV